jgi:hypothetical protein
LQKLLTRRLNSQLRHAGLDPASSVLLDFRLRGNDELRVFIRWSNSLIFPKFSCKNQVLIQSGYCHYVLAANGQFN